MSREVHHVGDDCDDVTMADVRAEESPERDADVMQAAMNQGRESNIPDSPNEIDTETDETTIPDEKRGNACCRWCEERFETITAKRIHTCQGLQKFRKRQAWNPEDEHPVINTNTHEFGAKLLFPSEEMSNYYAVVSVVDDLLSGDNPTVEHNDETWVIPDEYDDEPGVSYWTGSLAADDEEDFAAYNEYQIKLTCAEDDVRERKMTLQFRPAKPNLKHADSGDPIQSLPNDLPEGVRVQVMTSNLDVDEVLPLLRSWADAVDINTDYFADDNIHEWSRVYQFAKYVRVRRDLVEQHITRSGGLLEKLAQFGLNNSGKGMHKWENERGVAKYEATTLDATQWGKLMDNQDIGKRYKAYHPEHVRNEPDVDFEDLEPDERDPLTHPKIEVQYSPDYTTLQLEDQDRVTNDVPWSHSEYDVGDLEQEIDQTLINGLHWAGLDTRANPNIYVADEYFEVGETVRDMSIYEDPLDAVKRVEEDMAMSHLYNADLGDKEREVVQTVTSDGGQVHYEDLTDELDVSSSTVYRAVDKLGRVLEAVNGEIQFKDRVFKDKFEELFERVERMADWVSKSVRDLVQEQETVVGKDSALARWFQTYGIDYDDDILTIQRGRHSRREVAKIIRDGYEAAQSMGPKARAIIRDAHVKWRDKDGEWVGLRRAVLKRGGGTLKALGIDTLPVGMTVR